MDMIEEEMKPFCEVLNGLDGVDTDNSCYGHDNDSLAWIEFTVRFNKLDKLLSTFQSVEDKTKYKNYRIDLGFILSEEIWNVPKYDEDSWYKLNLDIDGHKESLTSEELKELSEIIKEESQ